MRVTFNSINRHIQKSIVDRYNDLANLQEQLSTGKRLLRPSDDPIDISNDLQLRTKLKQLSQYKKNISDGLGFMEVSDTAMMSLDSLVQRMRELAIQAASDTLSEKERLYLASEVEQLIRQALSLGNTTFKGDYVFAGAQTKIVPFPMESSKAATSQDYLNYRMAYYDASAAAPGTAVQLYDGYTAEPIHNIIPGTFQLSVAGTTYREGTDYTMDYVNGTITILATSPNAATLSADVSPTTVNYQPGAFKITFDYVGKGKDIYNQTVTNEGDIIREIEKGIVTPINITARDLTYDADTDTDLFEVMIKFGQNLLQNNQPGITTTITNLDISLKTLLAAQSKNGARINRFEITKERNELQYIETTRLQSELEDAELAETATNFAVTEMVYNAALQSAAKIIQPSLVNFL